MKTRAAQEIRAWADKIDTLDTFIRRDNGQVKNVDAIAAIVDANWGNRESMIAAFDGFTRKHRDTNVEYILGQFGGVTP